MTRAERMAIVALVCARLWSEREWIGTDIITDRLVWTAEWDADGYAGDYPWSRARRYVQQFIAGMKERGEVEMVTQGTAHYNSGGTLVDYRLTERGQRWLMMMVEQVRRQRDG